MSQPISAAVESAVDAYATKLLRMKSPPEACIDDSLGPYVTSMLRCSMGPENENVRELEEFDSLMELLEEHCSLSAEDALSSLSIIATAVRTGVMDVPVDPAMKIAVLEDIGSTLDDEPQFMFSKEEDVVSFNPQASDNYDSVTAKTPLPALEGNPLRSPDKFIPVDLMGVLDDPSTPTTAKTKNNDFESPDPKPEAFPPLGSTPPSATKKSSKPPRNSTTEQGKDLAASLFRPPRSRQQSIDETDGCASSASQSSPPVLSADIGYHTLPVNNDNQYFHQQHFNSAIDMLLSMNPDLSEEAAQEAAVLANADINVAQYVIDGAMSAPPVCRHMLNDGCYRSDCQFSHDVVGHTCLFWIRGRCGKGGSCRFRHGFSESLLAGINLEPASEKQDEMYTSSSVPIATKNLVSHNKEVGAPITNSWSSAGGGFSLGGYSLHSQGQQSSAGWEDYGVVARSLDKQTSNTFSFASIATKGYKSESFASSGVTQAMEETPKFVRIPQDLWNPHINRDATAFHIQDPLDRYAVVSKAVARDDTIDLHFQSTSSFAVVLSRILPQKLQVYDEVWVVTGSGHHVARDSHQKGGGVLESAVLKWMEAEGYSFVRGRDRNGHSGAVLARYGR